LRIRVDIRRKEKVEKAMEIVKRIKKIKEESRVILRKVQEKMK